MRMDAWNPMIISLMENASARSNYFDVLAHYALAGLPRGAHVVDAGCGMGQLAMRMAELGMRVSAIDRSAGAVGYFRTKAKERGVALRLADFTQPGVLPYGCDRVVFSLSAPMGVAFRCALRARARSIVVISKAHERRQSEGPRMGNAGMGDVAAELAALAFPCAAHSLELEYGQPFRSLKQAREYYALFRTRDYPGGVTEDQLRGMLQATDDDAFPYYLPVTRRLSLIEVDLSGACSESERSKAAYERICALYTQLEGERKVG